MEVPKTFKPKKGLEKKTEELLREESGIHKLKTDKHLEMLKLRIVRYNQEFLITYYTKPNRLIITQSSISIQGEKLKDFLILASDISVYHNGFTKMNVSCKKRQGRLEARCSMPLKYQPNSRDLLKALDVFYPLLAEDLRILEVKYKE